MAYVIAVCGAGGKTTLCFERAKYYISVGKSVAITTTTQMAIESFLTKYNEIDFSHIDKSRFYFVANTGNDKASPLSDTEYENICKYFDIVIVEADGSRNMPIKIIDENVFYEPCIPDNVDEIIIVMGKQAIGRRLKTVCHRFDMLSYRLKELKTKDVNSDTIVDEDLLIDFANTFYVNSLTEKFPNSKINIFLSDMALSENYKKYKKIAFSISASGFSNRFGSNKLFYKIDGIEIYKIIIDKCISAINNLKDNSLFSDIEFSLSFVTQYDVNLNQFHSKYLKNGIDYIKNLNPELGLSNSIKLATKKFYDYDAICYFNCDMPYIDIKSITNMIYYFVLSNKNIGAMCVNHILKNPAIFNNVYFDEILNISGDVGPREILKKYAHDCYFYHIDEDEMIDIDNISDIKNS